MNQQIELKHIGPDNLLYVVTVTRFEDHILLRDTSDDEAVMLYPDQVAQLKAALGSLEGEK
ncbi:MAG: hypothetical protein WCF84_02400 [Anaerolineae bacterium]